MDIDFEELEKEIVDLFDNDGNDIHTGIEKLKLMSKEEIVKAFDDAINKEREKIIHEIINGENGMVLINETIYETKEKFYELYLEDNPDEEKPWNENEEIFEKYLKENDLYSEYESDLWQEANEIIINCNLIEYIKTECIEKVSESLGLPYIIMIHLYYSGQLL
jgi:hypothetical protein